MYRNEVIISNVPYALNRPYAYTSDIQLDFGMLVNVSFGQTKTYGIVIHSEPMVEPQDDMVLKPIFGLVNHHSFLSQYQYELALSMAYQGFSALGKILVQMIPSFLRVAQPYLSLMETKISIDSTKLNDLKLTKGQLEIIDWLNQTGCDDYHQLINQFSTGRIQTLIKKEVLVKSMHLPMVKPPRFKWDHSLPHGFTIPSHGLYRMGLDQFIHGPLLDIMAKTIDSNQSMVIIAPSLVSARQVYALLSKMIDDIDLYDPLISDTIKRKSYYRFTHGQTTITIGTKSLLLLKPDANNIVILQAHDGAYLQDTDPRIHVDEVVKSLYEMVRSNLIFQTLIPPLSMLETMDKGQISVIEDQKQPTIECIDMKSEVVVNEFAPLSNQVLNQFVLSKKHLVISTSRKGWYYQVECDHCHTLLTCPSCSHLLQSTDTSNIYYCAHCGRTIKKVRCPKCHHEKWIYKKPGVLTLVDLLKEKYPSISIYGLTMDNADLNQMMDAFESSNASILVTTQGLLSQIMIHADGLIMLHGDSALAYRQYRNDEWAMNHIINGVTNVLPLSSDETIRIVQLDHSDHPLHPFLKHQDVNGYLKYESSYRKQMVLPPYTHIALIKSITRNGIDPLQQCIDLKPQHGYTIGPSESKSDRTYRLILRCPSLNDLQDWLIRWYDQLTNKYRHGLTILINPNTMSNE